MPASNRSARPTVQPPPTIGPVKSLKSNVRKSPLRTSTSSAPRPPAPEITPPARSGLRGTNPPTKKLIDCCADACGTATNPATNTTALRDNNSRRMSAPRCKAGLFLVLVGPHPHSRRSRVRARDSRGRLPALVVRRSRTDASRARKTSRKCASPREQCRPRVSLRPLWSTLAPKFCDDLAHRVVDQPVGRQHLIAARRERRALHVRHAPSGFLHDQRSAGDVPRLE